MSDSVNFFRELIKKIKQEINVAKVARITKIHDDGRIDAIAGEDVLIQMRKLSGAYEVGNDVLVVFLDDDGMHGLSDGLVVGVIG